jgi:hypothetical protein
LGGGELIKGRLHIAVGIAPWPNHYRWSAIKLVIVEKKGGSNASRNRLYFHQRSISLALNLRALATANDQATSLIPIIAVIVIRRRRGHAIHLH